jgi:hypothetical protein
MFMSATRGEIFAMVDIEKPGNKPGSRSKNTTYYTHLPRYKTAAQLLALLREQYATIGVHDTVHVKYPLFSRTAIWIALKFHTHSLAYLKKLAADHVGVQGGAVMREGFCYSTLVNGTTTARLNLRLYQKRTIATVIPLPLAKSLKKVLVFGGAEGCIPRQSCPI